MRTRSFICGLVVLPLILLGISVAIASSVSLPHVFVAGTPAVASEVNANFNAVAAAINDNELRMPGVAWMDIAATNVDVRTSAVDVGTVTINAPAAGFAVVRFAGQCHMSAGDRIVLAASDTSQTWAPNDGNVDARKTPKENFTHMRVYPVGPGLNTFYAVAHNFVQTAGTGMASIYGTLTVAYFPKQL